MQKPAGVSFGFGGKLVSFNETSGPSVNCRVVSSTDADLIRQADEVSQFWDSLGFEKATALR